MNNDDLYFSMLDLIAAFTDFINDTELVTDPLDQQVLAFQVRAAISDSLRNRLHSTLVPLVEPL